MHNLHAEQLVISLLTSKNNYKVTFVQLWKFRAPKETEIWLLAAQDPIIQDRDASPELLHSSYMGICVNLDQSMQQVTDFL